MQAPSAIRRSIPRAVTVGLSTGAISRGCSPLAVSATKDSSSTGAPVPRASYTWILGIDMVASGISRRPVPVTAGRPRSNGVAVANGTVAPVAKSNPNSVSEVLGLKLPIVDVNARLGAGRRRQRQHPLERHRPRVEGDARDHARRAWRASWPC